MATEAKKIGASVRDKGFKNLKQWPQTILNHGFKAQIHVACVRPIQGIMVTKVVHNKKKKRILLKQDFQI
jgi:hypothetical protein